MPLSPVSALNLDNTYLAQASCDRWVCRQTQDCIGMQEGYGSTEAEAREDLNRNIRRAPGGIGPCNVVEPTKCFILASGPCVTPTATPTPPEPTPPPITYADPAKFLGNYRLSDGTIFFSNGTDAYCTYKNSEHIFWAGNKEIYRARPDSRPPFRNDGPCPVRLPAGAYRLADGRIIASNGSAFCGYVSDEHYRRKDGRPITQIRKEIPLFAMENHFNCRQ